MKILFYSSKAFEIPFLKKSTPQNLEINFIKQALSASTASLAYGYDAISIFAGDDASTDVIQLLHKEGVKFIAIRAAGYDNVAIQDAKQAGMKVANVPEYSPYAIAEHTVAMMLALNRKLITAHEQVCKHNFMVDNLVGFDLHKKTVGIIGTGKIGRIVAHIMNGFGCRILAYDKEENEEIVNKYNASYSGLTNLCSSCDIITIHIPLNEHTRYLIDKKLISTMKKGVMIINTSRGGIVKTPDIIYALHTGQIGNYGMDVYEHERGVFFYDYSEKELKDEMLQTLLNNPNVLVTPHQAFATNEALTNIADTTFENLLAWNSGKEAMHELTNAHV